MTNLFIPDCNGEVSMKETNNIKLFLFIPYYWNRYMQKVRIESIQDL